MVLVLTRQKPHMIAFAVVAAMSGIGFLVRDPGDTPGQGKLPHGVSSAWAWCLVVTGFLTLVGILWQRWHFERGMLFARGALLLQSGAIIVYLGFLVGYLRWGATTAVIAGLFWAWMNMWEAVLIKRDLQRLEVA